MLIGGTQFEKSNLSKVLWLILIVLMVGLFAGIMLSFAPVVAGVTIDVGPSTTNFPYDEGHSVEQNPDSNMLSRDLQPSVDLRVEGLSISAEKYDPNRPRQITISFRIVNGGQQAITTPFRTSIFPGAVTDGVLDTFYLTTPMLPAGEAVYVSQSIVSPVGKFDVSVEADADHVITEADESNNIATAHFNNPTPDVGRWVSIGPRKILEDIGAGGRLDAIAIDPTDPLTIYVGTGSGQHAEPFAGSGVWKTTDGGSSWHPIADSLPSLNIKMLAIDPSAHSRIYAVTGDSGVFRSEDAGISWIQIASAAAIDINWKNKDLLVHPTNSNVLYLTSNKGILRSDDRGRTWNISLKDDIGISLVMDPSDPDILYAGIRGGSIYKTTNGGTNWSVEIGSTGIEPLLAISQNKPDTVYTIFNTAKGFELYRTDDAGKFWSRQSTLSEDFIGFIGLDPVNPDIVYLGGVDFHFSTDGGKNFEIINSKYGPHVDHHGFATHPTDPNIIYVTTDGGIYQGLLINRPIFGRTVGWRFIGEGIANVQFYDIANAVTNPNRVIGGTQDNENIKYDGNSNTWDIIGYCHSGDGDFVDIDPTNADTFYIMGQYSPDICKLVNGDKYGIGNNLPEDVMYYYQVHPTDPSILLASTNGSLWRSSSTPPGDWKRILNASSGGIVRSAVDTTIDLYYAGANDGRLYAGPSGASWQTVFPHPNGQGVTDIEVDPDNPKTVYVSFGGRGSGRVYRLQRSSPTPTTMTAVNITSNLPAGLDVQTVAVDRWTPLTIYAGTNRGVYRGRSIDGGATWQWTPYNNGLPLADITDLEIHPTTKVMRAATFGRSAFEVITGPLGNISGMKFNDMSGNGIKDLPEDIGLAGWEIKLTKKSDGTTISTKTNNTGNYIFTELDPDTYTVEEVLQLGWKQTVPSERTYTVTLSSGGDVKDKDFGNFKLGEVHGMKFNDTNGNGMKDIGESGLKDWTITLKKPDGSTVTTMTDDSGNYNFGGLLTGTYTVSEVIPSGWIQTAPAVSATGSANYTVTIATSGTVITGKDFGNFKLGEVHGMKFDDINGNGTKDLGEPGLDGWQINLVGTDTITGMPVSLTTTTDTDGSYNFTGLTAGTYVINETLQSGWIQTAPAVSATGSANHTVTIITSGTVITGKDFGNFKFGEVHGMKWEDLNANSKKDSFETGLSGWEISIKGTDTITDHEVNITTTTDANGNYSFKNLTEGTYIISERLKDEWVQTTPSNGTYTLTITSGANFTGQDFGNFHKGKISGGGWIPAPGDPNATYGLEGQYPDSSNTAQGNMEYQDHALKLNIKSVKINTVASTMNKKKGVITGLARVNGAGSYYFEAYVEDNGEPGKGVDVLKISLPTYPYSNGAILSSGNIQIHK